MLALSTPAAAENAAPAQEAAPKSGPQLGTYGFDTDGMDTSVSPADDFYLYANGKWAEKTQIPADKSNYGMFTALDDLSKERVKLVLEAEKDVKGSKAGDVYASYLDTATVEKKGLKPIQPWLKQVRGIKSKAAFEKMLPTAARNGVGALFGGFVGQDDKNPDVYIFQIYQGGTGLPDRDMYLVENDKFEAIRKAYKEYLAKMLTLAGEKNAVARADAIFAVEKKIAEVQWTREDSSDATKTYNKMTVAELDKITPGLKLSSVLTGVSPKITEVVVAQPSAITGIAKIFADTDLAVLKDQMIVNSLATFSNVLPDSVSDTTFAFYGTTLQGTPQREPRWKRGVSLTEGTVGDEVGKAYAAKYFPPETKAAMDTLVKNVLAAMGRRIDGLTWMQPETKAKARTKLANFTTKIGYPDRWKDYSKLKIVRGDLFGNDLRANQWGFDDNISKLGGPIRRWEWGMLPQTVNAYANFGMNEIVFPAAILQPPFFDPKADPAINYGGIGAVIGHEISHHFDDQGAKYDENGKLSDWWTESDVKAFEAAGKKLIAQYDAYKIFPDASVKGEFTLGENIGDLAGLTIAYDAYRASLNGKEPPVIDGMTGDQRFFLGWAQVWRRNYREANLRQRLITDPHSPSAQRAWVVRNLDKWYDAFQPKADGKLYLKPEERVRIW
ncbi:M13 family metallopeptidase [Sphingorhabdus contaminans]|uniref:M13 family metallopeptidase n=2 Tax=Sphingorhabdus contaminans TaxID=1343899 RepID=A0A553WKY1_9SPHN|nr:M13 family metallopeptidase [Sphingorhabdus contaminans]